MHKISERISIKVKQEEATTREKRVKRERVKGRYEVMERRKGRKMNCFYLIRVHRTRLLHLNMITSHKAISKVVCGKLVRGN